MNSGIKNRNLITDAFHQAARGQANFHDTFKNLDPRLGRWMEDLGEVIENGESSKEDVKKSLGEIVSKLLLVKSSLDSWVGGLQLIDKRLAD